MFESVLTEIIQNDTIEKRLSGIVGIGRRARFRFSYPSDVWVQVPHSALLKELSFNGLVR